MPSYSVKHSLMHVMIELFFAVLPLIVLSFYWPKIGEHHPKSFFYGPEWSMTSCVLYGLSLSRFLNANIHPTPERGPAVALISIVPMVGLIMSVIFISKTCIDNDNIAVFYGQYINMLSSIITFIVLGGYGLSRSEQYNKLEG